jgi:hypothetical protein
MMILKSNFLKFRIFINILFGEITRQTDIIEKYDKAVKIITTNDEHA